MLSLMDVDSACEGKGDKQEERKMGMRYEALKKRQILKRFGEWDLFASVLWDF